MRMSRVLPFLMFAVILALPGIVFAQAAITGQYDCSGANADGSGAYTGTVTITKDSYDAYKFKWSLGGDSYSGIGIVTGDVISVGYKAVGSKDFGVVAYQVKDGGATLVGKWIFYPGGSRLANETLKRK